MDFVSLRGIIVLFQLILRKFNITINLIIKENSNSKSFIKKNNNSNETLYTFF